MGKPNEKNNNEQVNQVKTSTSIVKWKNTVPITKTVMEFVAASALAGLAIALATQTVTLASLVALPQAHVIAIGIFVYFAVYYALSTYASYQKMSEIAKLEVKTEGANTLAKGAGAHVEKAKEQALEAGKHAQAAKSSENAAEKTKAETVKAAETAAQKLVSEAGKNLINAEVKTQAETIAKTVVTDQAEVAVQKVVDTKGIITLDTLNTELDKKANMAEFSNLNDFVNNSTKGLAAQNQAITKLNTTVDNHEVTLNGKVASGNNAATIGLITNLKALQVALADVSDEAKPGVAQKLKDLLGKFTTLNKQVSDKNTGLLDRTTTIETAVGNTDNEGLRKKVADNTQNITNLETSVTDETKPGVAKRIKGLEDQNLLPIASLLTELKALDQTQARGAIGCKCV